MFWYLMQKRWLDLSSWLVSKRCQVGALFSFLLHRTLRGSHNLVKYWLWEIFYYFYCSSRFRWGNLSNISTFYFIIVCFCDILEPEKPFFKKTSLGGHNGHIFSAENAIVSVSVNINSYLCTKIPDTPSIDLNLFSVLQSKSSIY